MGDRTCPCGATFVVPVLAPKKKYCSPACYSSANAVRGSVSKSKPVTRCLWCDHDVPQPRGHGKTREFCNSRCRSYHHHRGSTSSLNVTSCAFCLMPLVARHGRKFCSASCRDKDIYSRARRTADCPVLQYTTCVICERPRGNPKALTKCCSGECHAILNRINRKQGKARRRVRLRAGLIEVFESSEIFERDGWTCQLCGRSVSRYEVVPHSKAPTIDHVIPVARGGDHTRANVQCAHFLCNSIKSDRVNGTGEQLRLVG